MNKINQIITLACDPGCDAGVEEILSGVEETDMVEK
jgi:hypothetical protein